MITMGFAEAGFCFVRKLKFVVIPVGNSSKVGNF